VETKRVLKTQFASSVLHSSNVKTQICVTRPQCVKMKHESSLSTNYVTGSIHLCGFPSLSLNFTCVQLTPTSSSLPSFQTMGQMQQTQDQEEDRHHLKSFYVPPTSHFPHLVTVNLCCTELRNS